MTAGDRNAPAGLAPAERGIDIEAMLCAFSSSFRSRRTDRTLERFQARRIEIAAPVDLPRQVDGEIATAGRTLAVSVYPAALTVRGPR